MNASERWASELAAWAIPDYIMAQAPESPWEFSPKMFRPPLEPVTTKAERLPSSSPDSGADACARPTRQACRHLRIPRMADGRDVPAGTFPCAE